MMQFTITQIYVSVRLKQMINKLLCFMLGCQFDKVWCLTGAVRWGRRINTEYIAEFNNCIHCGKVGSGSV